MSENSISNVNTNSDHIPNTSNSSSNSSSSSVSSHSISTMQQSQMNYLGIENTVAQGIHPQIHQRSAFDTSHHAMIPTNPLNLEDQYIREQQLRYSQQINEINNTIARPTVSYPSEIVSSRVNYDISSRAYDSNGLSSTTAFDRYDPNCLPQRPNMYPYLQPTMEDINNQQKYLHEQQQMAHAMLKAEHDENNSGPVYPRPMYHYDPATGTLPPGFSAINLSVKISAAQAASYKAGCAASPGGPVIDLSTSSVTSSSPHNFNSPHYAGQRGGTGSPHPAVSPHLASPQVPSPQGQTLDLSVSRLSHNRFE